MAKKFLCFVAALMISFSSLAIVGCSSEEDPDANTPADAKPNMDEKPTENGDTPPEDTPPSPN